jgi:excisionase family DNA binding protein
MKRGTPTGELQAGAGRVPMIPTIGEVADLLRCSKAHVQNLLSGRVAGAEPLPFIPLGRRKLIRRECLFQWMERAEAANQC